MPELPEVETTRRRLEPDLVGQTFTAVTIRWPRSIMTPVAALLTILPGLKIESLDRRGKYLLIRLSQNFTLCLHLKMSGQLTIEPTSTPPHHHVRTAFSLANGSELRFRDSRKFGRVYLVENVDEVVGTLGPEPLGHDFTAKSFLALCHSRKGRLKPLLLDQHFIAGIGNIYADESLFQARIHPGRAISSLSTREVSRLYQAIRHVLDQAITLNGTTLDDVYPDGAYQNHFQVYGRRDQPCHSCQSMIQRIVLAGRSTHFCPHCQKST